MTKDYIAIKIDEIYHDAGVGYMFMEKKIYYDIVKIINYLYKDNVIDIHEYNQCTYKEFEDLLTITELSKQEYDIITRIVGRGCGPIVDLQDLVCRRTPKKILKLYDRLKSNKYYDSIITHLSNMIDNGEEIE